MPEILTRHPEITLKLLKNANIKCGIGEKQQILTSCPKDRFCSLPKGELCIYGVKDISQMTQLNTRDVFLLPNVTIIFIAIAVLIFLIGMIAGIQVSKK